MLQLRNSEAVFANGLHEETGIALAINRKPGLAKIVGDPVWERALNAGRTQLGILEFNRSKLKPMDALQRKLLVWSLNRFTQVTCPSKGLCELVISWGVRTPVKWIANGTEVNDLKNEDKVYDLACISRLVKWKNIDTLIRAIQGTQYSLAIVGNGPEEATLRSLAVPNENISFLGYLHSKGVKNVISRSRAFVLISEYEGLSFSLLQAMERSIPVIVSDIQGNTDVVNDGVEGYVVDQNSQNDILNAIERLLRNDEVITEKGIAARKRIVSEFDQNIQLQKMCDLFTNSLNGYS
jgi:glycosyltransferase involved in cell wall biosynthesis